MPDAGHSTMEYVITERRERLSTQGKIFDLLLTPSAPNSSAKRVSINPQDWQTFAPGDAVGYEAGRLWHKELPDQPIETEGEE